MRAIRVLQLLHELSAVQHESDFTADSILRSCLFQAFVVIASYEIKLFHHNEEHGKYSATKAAYDQDQNMSTVRKCIRQYSFVMVSTLELCALVRTFFCFPSFDRRDWPEIYISLDLSKYENFFLIA